MRKPLTQAERAQAIEEGKRIAKLRESLKIPRTEFAAMCGFSNPKLVSKESGRVPLRTGELETISQVTARHLAAALRAQGDFEAWLQQSLSKQTTRNRPTKKPCP